MAGLFFQQYSKLSSPIPLANLKLWLKADAGITLNGSYVSVWADQSGNGNDATQSNAARQPLFVADGGVDVNNKPVLRFYANDWFSFSGFPIGNQNSIFIVCKSNGGDGPVLASNYVEYNLWLSNSALLYDYPGGNGANWAGTYTNYSVLNSNQNILSVGLNINGIAQANKTLNNYKARIIDRMGQLLNAYFIIGYIAEIIVYDGAISGGNIITVNNYLMTKYIP